jgi:hypothetical protein
VSRQHSQVIQATVLLDYRKSAESSLPEGFTLPNPPGPAGTFSTTRDSSVRHRPYRCRDGFAERELLGQAIRCEGQEDRGTQQGAMIARQRARLGRLLPWVDGWGAMSTLPSPARSLARLVLHMDVEGTWRPET